MEKTVEAKFIAKKDDVFKHNKNYVFTIGKGEYDDIFIETYAGDSRAYQTIIEFLNDWTNIKFIS